MRRAVLTLALSALAIFPTAASAADPAPSIGRFDSATVTRALEVADASWSPNVCAGASHAKPITSADALTMFNVDNAYGFVAAREAASDPCGFWLVSDAFGHMTAAGLCSVMAREVGHLLGLGHNEADPTDVMFPGYVGDTAACAAAFPRPTQTPAAAPAIGAADDAPVVIDDHDDTPRPRWTAIAPTPHLVTTTTNASRRLDLTLSNQQEGKLVVTF